MGSSDGIRVSPDKDLIWHADTPVEIIHTILLGAVRYVWHHLHSKQWSDEDRHLLAIHLESTDISNMNMPPMRAAYKIQYRNNLIGKDYKAIMQALVFHIHGICTPEQFQLVKATADLGAWVWVPEIDDMPTYIAQLKIAVANVLDAWDAVDPLRIIVKIKLHLLAHLAEDVEWYGPPVRFSTETQEGYNAIFRMCSINGNNQAPSRDIAAKFASMATVKHILCGGYWQSTTDGKWIQSGEETRKLLLTDPMFQRHLGWVQNSAPTPGFVRFLGIKTTAALAWAETKAKQYWTHDKEPSQAHWRRGKYVIAQSGDQVKEHTWVFARDGERNPVLGRVKEIIGDTKSNMAFVTLERFICTDTRHPDFLWPVVRRPNGPEIQTGRTSFLVVNGVDILFSCSVQHNCRNEGCRPSVFGKQQQEREETNHDVQLIKHTDDNHFILNLGCLHNFVELTRLLPAPMYRLEYLQSDRKGFHTGVTAKAHNARDTAREKTAQERRANAQAKLAEAVKAAADAQQAANDAVVIPAGACAADVDEDGGDGSEPTGALEAPADDTLGDSEVEEQSDPEGSDESDGYVPGGKRKRQPHGRGRAGRGRKRGRW
ncbi:hypothetical protein MIND_00198900 [Mycena indigotica]|uniref:Uncharacterized protein n=1 Tax=Mycena indigotica TaxID=2126181 RepID=A0A8H6T6N3_9AGAR|nr:uncharacterized protein MIND_00198900 [Mycena indigotica]KAF7311880.1 hypothetical protein MIND_00198900 [Mycena indigotica]